MNLADDYAAIARAMADSADPELYENCVGCEACERTVPVENAIPAGDCYFCEDCYDKWKAESDKCAHVYEPDSTAFGPGKTCQKCGRFEADEI